MAVIVDSLLMLICSYVEKYGLNEPSDDINYVLKRVAVKLRKTQRVTAITGVGKKILILHVFMEKKVANRNNNSPL